MLERYSHKYREIPENFENGFRKATLVFSHQRVFDPERRKLVHLREVNEMVTVVEDDPTMSFLGPDLLDKDVCMIADGLIDPHTREEFVVSLNENFENKRTKELGAQLSLYVSTLRMLSIPQLLGQSAHFL